MPDNEGQKLVRGLQDLQSGLDEKRLEAPQLLSGITLKDDEVDDRHTSMRKREKKDLETKAIQQSIMLDKFDEQRKKDQQSLFREREVQNLRDMIYGDLDGNTTAEDIEESLIVDTNRYDVHPSKLEMYSQPDMKKLLKSKFVTGQSQEQIMKNLLNMSDSDEEEDPKSKKKGPKKGKEIEEE